MQMFQLPATRLAKSHDFETEAMQTFNPAGTQQRTESSVNKTGELSLRLSSYYTNIDNCHVRDDADALKYR